MHEFSPYRVRRSLHLPTTERGDCIDRLKSAGSNARLSNDWRLVKKRGQFMSTFCFGNIVMSGTMTGFLTLVYTPETSLRVDLDPPRLNVDYGLLQRPAWVLARSTGAA
jgi:hypothetical protein